MTRIYRWPSEPTVKSRIISLRRWVKLFLAVFKKVSLILFAVTSWILNPRIVQDCSYSTRIRAISVVVLNSWPHCRLQDVETDFVECGQTTRVKRARTVCANCRWLWFVILHVSYIDGCFNNYMHVYGNVAFYCVHVYTNPNTIYPELLNPSCNPLEC